MNCDDAQLEAVYQYELQTKALADAVSLLSENGIDCVPLKGALLRAYYEKPWMRRCIDIDIYVRPKDFSNAEKLLCSEGFIRQTRCAHHVSYIAPNGVLTELHFALAEEGKIGKRASIADESFAEALFCSKPESTAEYYIYHLLHMLTHFCEGGCGKKFFADLWILNHALEHEDDFKERKEDLLKKAVLQKFDHECCRLADHWFGKDPDAADNEADQVSDDYDTELASYVESGGTYGTEERKAAYIADKKGRIGYVLYRIFPPLSVMKGVYPVLNKAPLLLPFTWIARAISRLNHGYLDQMKNEISAAGSVRADDMEFQRHIFSKLGI